MLRDPEALEHERRPRLVTGGTGGSLPAAIADSVDVDPVAVTAELLARLRAGDDLVDGVRWLCIVRSDRRPATAEQLRQAIEAVAAQDGVDVDQVRAGIARALAAEGRNLDAWEASLRGARPLGRSTRTDQAATASTQRHGRQLILLEPTPDNEAEPGAATHLRTARGNGASSSPDLQHQNPPPLVAAAAPRRPKARGLFHTSDGAEGLPVAQDQP